jgi:DNA (cytosine-5)-methyltransferase 1
MMSSQMPTFLEFFAGGGMARLGLGPEWRCVFANDIDPVKCAAYADNFGDNHLNARDIATLSVADLPDFQTDLAWASFPCQDLSLAGARGGLSAARSGMFHEFWRLMRDLRRKQRTPRLIVLENVAGLMSSNGGDDFRLIASKLARCGYLVSARMIDARHFTPQSRPRFFIFGFAQSLSTEAIFTDQATEDCRLAEAVAAMPDATRRNWRWLKPAPQVVRNTLLADIIETDADVDPAAVTGARVSDMSPRHQALIASLVADGGRHVGGAFRRVRIVDGNKIVRVEPRFDGLAGCLRTPAGGSSRQIVFVIDKGDIHSRLMSPREAARLMGLDDAYRLPATTTAALKVCGDGVCPPVVRWISENILLPTLAADATSKRRAA